MNTRIVALLTALLLMAAPFVVLGQEALMETFEGAFTFDYPADWLIEEDGGWVFVTNEQVLLEDGNARMRKDDVFMVLVGSQALADIGLNANASPRVALLTFLSYNEIEAGETDSIDVDGREGVFTSIGDGIGLGLPFSDGSVGVMVVWAAVGEWTRFEETALAIAATFDSGSGTVTAVSGLAAHAGEWQDTVSELEDIGLVSSGGGLVFDEDYAFFSGQGSWFTPLASRSPFTNIVMAGEITYEVGDDSPYEMCVLSSRIETNSDGDAIRYVNIGIMQDGSVIIVDLYSDSEDAHYDFARDTIDLGRPHHLLLHLDGDLANVYVDGERVITDFEVVVRSGTYGIGLLDAGPNASCEGNNIWVYQFPSTTPGICIVSSTRGVNQRNGPGTDFDSPGQLEAGEDARAEGQAIGADGFVWWQLEDGSWVRDDVVDAVGDCANVPTVTG